MHSLTFLHVLRVWLLSTSFVIHSTGAQGQLDSMPFYWGIQSDVQILPQVVTTVPECATVQLFIHDNHLKQLQPPFYLFAYEANGIPTVNAVGSNIDNLSWTVGHASGSQLILSLTDARGVSGGIDNYTYTVQNGGTSSCLPSIPKFPFSVSANVTKTLNTCDVLHLDIHGGVPPYNLTVATLNANGVFNISIGKFSGYDWVNQMPPYVKLIATVSDATGTYGVSTPLLATMGSPDLKCNLKSGPRNSSDPAGPTTSSGLPNSVDPTTDSGPPVPTDSSSSSSSTGKDSGAKITGITAAMIGALVIVGLLFWWKKNRVRQDRGPGGGSGGYGPVSGVPDDTSTPLVEVVSSPLMETASSSYSTSTVARPAGSVGAQPRPESAVSWTTSASMELLVVASSPTGLLAVANPGPGSEVGELLEADVNVGAGLESPSTQQQSRQTWVIQHEDVEDVVEELPPAYKERTS